MTTSSSERASRLRQALCRLRDEAVRLIGVFLSREQHVRGSVYELRRKCGKPSCACAAGGPLHSCTVITWSAGGRKRLRSLSPKEQLEVTRMTERYRRLRRARARLVDVQGDILDIVEQLEVLRRREP